MFISLLAAAAGAVVALAGTIALAIRCVRMPRADLIAWACAMFGLAVALAAQAAGFAVGFGPFTFRAVQLGAQVVATLGLALGLAEVAASSLPVRFAVRLAVSALGVVSLVILATDPLGTAAFSKAFPAASAHYQPISNSLLTYVLAPFTALAALIAIFVTAGRSRRDPAWQATFPAVVAAGLAAVALAAPGLAALASSSQVSLASAFPLLCVLAAALTWLAASHVRRIRLDVVHQRSAYGDEDDDEDEDGWARGRSRAGRETGDYDLLTGGGGRYPGDRPYGGYPDDVGYEQSGRGEYADKAGYGNGGEYGAGGGYPAGGGYGADDGYPAASGGPYDDAGLPGSAVPGGPAHAGAMPAGVPAGLAPAGTDPDEMAQENQAGIWQPPSPGPGDAGRPGMPAASPGPPGVPGIPAGLLSRQPGLPGGQPGLPEADDQEAWSRLFGQIAIYTLLEDRVNAFDGLTQEVVELVRAREPGTLMYIVHAVPSAPMQRILYEVYRDREAYEEHKRQPYIAKFEVDKRPYVLATNVIELGLQRAKVSPPSISDLLSRPGGGPPGPARPVPGGPLGAAAPGGPLGAAAPAGGAEGSGGPASLGRGPRRLP